MKASDWIIIFSIIFICFTSIVFFGINQDRTSTVVNEEYANMLTIACHDTVKTADLELIKTGVWPTEESRQSALAAFYSTLAYCMNNEYMEEEKSNHLFIPSVVLIDVDGYYVSYNSALDDKGNVYIGTSSSGNEYSRWMSMADSTGGDIIANKNAYKEGVTISPINTWTAQYGDYTVRFYLNDEMSVIYSDASGKTYVQKGTPEKLKKEFEQLVKEGKIVDSTLDGVAPNRNTADTRCSFRQLLTDSGKFDREKSYVIVSQINNEVEYYINYHNAFAEENDIPYSYTMPDIKGESWHRLLKNPTAIAFMQGRQMQTGKQFTNVYALSGGELVKQHKYYITEEGGKLYYHNLYAKNCPLYTTDCVDVDEVVNFKGGQMGLTPDVYETIDAHQEWYKTSKSTGIRVPISDEGDPVETLYDSMEECARQGAYPCECAINHN